jgi:4'-phosphopantetheinyl transferase
LAGPLAQCGFAFLSSDEIDRYRRYLVPEAAQTFVAARVLVRSLLSSYVGLEPEEWRFEANPWGRPHIANPGTPGGLFFNLSHKPGFLTCLVGPSRDLGVDVEDISANRPYLFQIAERFFSSSEAAGLRALPGERQTQRFYELWTLKEAYIKARGVGLSLGLSKFSFSVEGDSAQVRFDPGFDDDPGAWDFRLFRFCSPHLISTAVQRLKGRPVPIEIADAAGIVARALARQID